MLELVPKPVLAAIALAALVLAGLAGILATKRSIQFANEKTAHAETRTAFAEARAQAASAVAAAERRHRDTERRWSNRVQEVADGTQIALDEARKRGAAAVAAGDRLRDKITELAACADRGAPAPAVAGSGPTAGKTADLLADVQRRLDRAAEDLARFADASSIAGQACERAWEVTR